MPRRRPGALRAEQPRTSSPRAHIRGLSSRTCHAIHLVEKLTRSGYDYVGFTAKALNRYEQFLSQGSHERLYPASEDCRCPGCVLDDVRNARDHLGYVLWKLPKGAHTELSRRLAPLDARYLRRTLQDPFSDPNHPWWRRRLPDD